MRRALRGASRRLVLAGLLTSMISVPVTVLLAPESVSADGGSNTGSVTVNGILAVVSPEALPACSAAGSASLLVPILGGAVQQKLDIPTQDLDVADVILKALGPVYVVCGQLPRSPGTECELDSHIAALWPSELTQVGTTSPNLVGDQVDAINAALKVLGLPPAAALEKPLDCSVTVDDGAPPAPPPAQSPVPPPSVASPSETLPALTSPELSGAFPTSAATGQVSALPSTPPAGEPAAARASGAPVVEHVFPSQEEVLPGGLLVAQLFLAVLLALVLAGGWLTSGRLAWLQRTKKGSAQPRS